MREILFRGKRRDNGEWVEGGYIPLDVESGYAYIVKPYHYASSLSPLDIIKLQSILVLPETVGQYTGITDNTGKKIFEGDIVKEYNIFGVEVGIGAVHWSDLFLAWHITKNKSMYSGNIASYEVIGNIHDNPELLEGGE